MKIEVRERDEKDYGVSQRLFINGMCKMEVSPLWECPEDAIIGRDLVSCCDVVHFMRLAHEAGRQGEEFDYTFIKDKPG